MEFALRFSSFSKIKAKLAEAEISEVEQQNQRRVKYLGLLLEQRQTWQYRGDKENADLVQHLIYSLCTKLGELL